MPIDRRSSLPLAASTAWGFAEATLFFIVPDVLLTWIALANLRQAFASCAAALAGALVGGCVMYAWGAADAPSALATIQRVPAVDQQMVERVGRSMSAHDLWPIFVGPLAGTPYKIYAAQAGALDLPASLFLFVSVPARGARFVLLTLLAAGAAAAIGDRASLRTKRALHLAAWTAFYVWYFAVIPS